MQTKLVLLAASLAFVPTFASAGTVQFTGEIVASTCDTSSGSDNLTINLTPIDAGALSAEGQTAGHHVLPIKLTCTSASGRKVAVKFTSANFADPVTGHLKPDTSSTATNVQLAVYNTEGEVQQFNAAPTASSWKDTTNGDIALDHTVAYYATGPAGEGTIRANATFDVVYQ